MIRSILRWMKQVSRRLPVRVILYAVLNVIAVAAATVIGPLIPQGVSQLIGAEAVDTILQVLATSMLTVVTFSLTIMVSAFARAEGQWTPRIHILLREDTRTQSVLAAFLGSYVYALIAIIMRAAEVFDEREVVILFGMTVLVVVALLVQIVRWIVHLEGLGSLPQVAGDLETRAAHAVETATRQVAQGANPLTSDTRVPEAAQAVHATRPGYVQQIYEDALQDIAEGLDVRIYVVAPVGRYVQTGEVIARVDGAALDDNEVFRICAAIDVAAVRSLDMDPVFGVTVLAEIGTRALSPGVNDPGTAIDVVHRLSRVLCVQGQADEAGKAGQQPENDRLWIEPLDPDALFAASFDPLARCAGPAVEVHLAIRRALLSIRSMAGPAMRDAAGRAAEHHRARALRLLDDPHDRARFEARLD